MHDNWWGASIQGAHWDFMMTTKLFWMAFELLDVLVSFVRSILMILTMAMVWQGQQSN